LAQSLERATNSARGLVPERDGKEFVDTDRLTPSEDSLAQFSSFALMNVIAYVTSSNVDID